MRAARLHGVRDLRVEELPDPVAAHGELLIRVEACGICPTDVRKYLLGTDGFPLNPGHEWVGHVEVLGPGVEGWEVGDRVYGDTYAGYAEFAALPVEPGRGRTARCVFRKSSRSSARSSWSRSPTASTR